MQPDERMNDFQLALQAAQDGLQSRIWTAMPGIVESYDPATQTCSVQCAVQAQTLDAKKNTWSNVNLPLLGKVPVAWPSGGAFQLTFPLKKGDEGIVIFGTSCIDGWWDNGGVQPQMEVRRHDLSDGMFVPGIRAKGRVSAPPPDANKVQLRSDDGAVKIEIAAGNIINLVAPGGINITGPLNINGVDVTHPTPTGVQFGGDVSATGTVKANAGTPAEVGLSTHRHPANNTPPTPGT